MKTPSETASNGAQALERGLMVLRTLSQCPHADGLTLAAVAQTSGLTKATARRLLLALERAGLVQQNPATRAYRLGVGAHALGLAARRQFDLTTACTPALRRIADATGDLALFQARSGDDAVCLAREIGRYPLQAALQSVGERYPIGVGAGGTAILAAMPEAEGPRLIQRMLALGHEAPVRVAKEEIEARVRTARSLGYHYHDGRYWPGIRELSVAVIDPHGAPWGAITLGTVEQRMPESRIPTLMATLRAEKARMEQDLASL